MKKYSHLRINESSVKCDDRSRFIAYAEQKAEAMLESGNYAFHLSGLFEDTRSYSEKLDNLLKRYYPEDSNISFETAKENFDQDFDTVENTDTIVIESIEKYMNAVANNPNDPLSHTLLKEAIKYNHSLVSSFLIQESMILGKYLDVSGCINESILFDIESSVFGVHRTDQVQLLESLMRGLIYVNTDECKKVYESLSNVLRIYKEGITLIKSNETSTLELFTQYLNTGSQSIVYTISQMQRNVKDPAALALLCISYFNLWIGIHENKLKYKFVQEDFNRLNNIEKEFVIHLGRDFNDELKLINIDSTGFDKLYQTLELLQGISQNVRLDLRAGISKFISIIRPMIDSLRLSFRRINHIDDTL